MRRFVLIAAALALLAGLPAPVSAGAGAALVKGGLAFPTAFAFTPNGARIFYVERFTGEVRVLNLSNGADRLFYTVTNIVSDGERGMLGITVHPNYPTSPYVYIYATRNVNGAKNQLIRLTNKGGTGTGFVALMTSNSISGYHNGGAIRVGPDRRLYALVGDGHSSANAQNTGNNLGKVLRMNLSGKPIADNPFGNRIYSYGHRNMFGLAFDPQGGGLWATENGPTCNDEVNFIVRGGNYAWGPNQDCTDMPAPQNTNQDGPAPRRLPEVFYASVIAPTGAEFCDGCGLAGQQGDLLFGANNDGRVRSLTLDAGRDDVTSQAVIYDHPGPIISMVAAPNGRVYFSDTGGIWRLTP